MKRRKWRAADHENGWHEGEARGDELEEKEGEVEEEEEHP